MSLQPTIASEHPMLNDLLAGYSAGSLDPALHALVASHLMMSPHNRGFVSALDGLCAQTALEGAPVPMRDRDLRLQAIFDAPDVKTPAVAASVMPAPLQRLLGGGPEAIRWRWKLPGVKECRVSGVGAVEANFYLIKPGRRLPSHTHEGSEITLVLQGGFSDTSGHYGVGDIAIADAQVNHRPRADLDEDCLCFAVTDAPLHMTGPIGRILDRLFGPKH